MDKEAPFCDRFDCTHLVSRNCSCLTVICTIGQFVRLTFSAYSPVFNRLNNGSECAPLNFVMASAAFLLCGHHRGRVSCASSNFLSRIWSSAIRQSCEVEAVTTKYVNNRIWRQRKVTVSSRDRLVGPTGSLNSRRTVAALHDRTACMDRV